MDLLVSQHAIRRCSLRFGIAGSDDSVREFLEWAYHESRLCNALELSCIRSRGVKAGEVRTVEGLLVNGRQIALVCRALVPPREGVAIVTCFACRSL